MKTMNLEQYLNKFSSLCPSDQDVGLAVVASEWWAELKLYFDDLIWLYFPRRYVFMNERFSSPDDTMNYNNIKRSFAVWLKTNKHNIDRLYKGYMSEFEPLWNVDGVTGHVSKDVHSGTVTDTHSGDDSIEYDETNNLSYKGTETDALSGTDTTSRANTTFESGDTYFPESTEGTVYGKTNTHSFTTRSDDRDIDGSKTTTYNSVNEKENDLLDEHVDIEIRQGNIGVVSSAKLLTENQELYMQEFMQLWKWIVRMCVNQVSYTIEGVD